MSAYVASRRIRRRGWVALLAGCLLLSTAALARQGAVHEALPDRIDPGARYLIYLHGRIIEDQGRRPTHPRYGVYEYQQILETLAAGGFDVVSEQRPPSTDMDEFAARVTDQVQRLLAAGVPPGNVSVVGFSKGGGIAIRTAALLHDPRVNFVFLAACGGGDLSSWDIEVSGRILSVHESSDQIDTGQEHGAFYRPRSEWLEPIFEWLRVESEASDR